METVDPASTLRLPESEMAFHAACPRPRFAAFCVKKFGASKDGKRAKEKLKTSGA